MQGMSRSTYFHVLVHYPGPRVFLSLTPNYFDGKYNQVLTEADTRNKKRRDVKNRWNGSQVTSFSTHDQVWSAYKAAGPRSISLVITKYLDFPNFPPTLHGVLIKTCWVSLSSSLDFRRLLWSLMSLIPSSRVSDHRTPENSGLTPHDYSKKKNVFLFFIPLEKEAGIFKLFKKWDKKNIKSNITNPALIVLTESSHCSPHCSTSQNTETWIPIRQEFPSSADRSWHVSLSDYF